MTRSGNLLCDAGGTLPAGEAIDCLINSGAVRIERIVSIDSPSPPGIWYDQPDAECVLLVSGAAGLWIEGEPPPRSPAAGDWINLPAHCRHRVEWTAQGSATVWLAIHYPQPLIDPKLKKPYSDLPAVVQRNLPTVIRH